MSSEVDMNSDSQFISNAVDISPNRDQGILKTIINPGEGEEMPRKGDLVEILYVGKLKNGNVFDSSADRDKPFQFTLGKDEVIKAWNIGVATMRKGEKSLLICHPHFLYGRGTKLSAEATLIFEVELIQWKLEINSSKDGGQKEEEFMFKIVIYGNEASGKTSLLHRLIENKFSPSLPSIMGLEIGNKTLNVLGTLTKMCIYVLRGQEETKNVIKYYKEAVGALLVYDITSRKSYDFIKDFVIHSNPSKPLICMLIGMKVDIVKKREVPFLEASGFAEDNELIFFETSSVTGEYVKESFEKCCWSILVKIKAE